MNSKQDNKVSTNEINYPTIDFRTYQGNGYIDAIKVRNIVKIKIVGKDERVRLKLGSNNVLVLNMNGEKEYIDRLNLINNYRHISNSHIKLRNLRNDKVYTVISIVQQPYAVMLLADNMRGIINPNTIVKNMYIVAKRNEDGSVDLSSVTAISKKMFRKMFVIPNQEILERYKGKIGSQTIKYNRKRRNNKEKIVTDSTSHEIGNTLNTTNSSDGINTPSSLNQESNMPINKTRQSDSYCFEAVGRIVNNNGVLVGILLRDKQGNEKGVNINSVMGLCSKHKVSNVTVARKDNGTVYIRGNGISLESLPKFLS